MRFIVLLLVGLLITKVSSGQSDIPLVFEGCENADNQESCSLLKLADIISNDLNNKVMPYSVPDGTTLLLGIRFFFNKSGYVEPQSSVIVNIPQNSYEEFEALLTKIPLALSAHGSQGEARLRIFTSYLSFKKQTGKFKIVKISKDASEEQKMLERIPVYEGCKTKWSNEKIAKCNSSKITAYFKNNFKKENLDSSFYIAGEFIRGKIHFFIETDGSISISNIEGPDLSFKKEVERIIKRFDKISSPGYIGPKAIRASQFMPISLVF